MCLSSGAGCDALASSFALRRLAWRWGSEPEPPRQRPLRSEDLRAVVRLHLGGVGHRVLDSCVSVDRVLPEGLAFDQMSPSGD